eukprot:766428-Hanusia_phi.AAC.6
MAVRKARSCTLLRSVQSQAEKIRRRRGEGRAETRDGGRSKGSKKEEMHGGEMTLSLPGRHSSGSKKQRRRGGGGERGGGGGWGGGWGPRLPCWAGKCRTSFQGH